MRYLLIMMAVLLLSCQDTNRKSIEGDIKLIILDPGHFHASLIQKSKLPRINEDVYVFAPKGQELDLYLAAIESYNKRPDDPTAWHSIVYSEGDYLEKMIKDKPGNVVVLSGNNAKKSEYINQSVKAGLHILCDKPMTIDMAGFKALEEAYLSAEKQGVLLYDIMTERYEETNAIQRELINSKELFGELQQGSAEEPAIVSESVHHFLKEVSGKSLIRPAWYYDVAQQGDGIVDVTTHLIDLVNYNCFPKQVIDYKEDIVVNDAGRWPTKLSLSDFTLSTSLTAFPAFLSKYIVNDTLNVSSNGYIQYTVNGVHTRVNVVWNLKAPEGAGDTHRFVVKGTRSTILIMQGQEQGYKPRLYIRKEQGVDDKAFVAELDKLITNLQAAYPGLSYKDDLGMIQIVIPDNLRKGHEAHFAKVVDTFLSYMKNGKLPRREVSNTLAKYYITTRALELAKAK